ATTAARREAGALAATGSARSRQAIRPRRIFGAPRLDELPAGLDDARERDDLRLRHGGEVERIAVAFRRLRGECLRHGQLAEHGDRIEREAHVARAYVRAREQGTIAGTLFVKRVRGGGVVANGEVLRVRHDDRLERRERRAVVRHAGGYTKH